MCSSGDPDAKALQKSQAKMTATLNADYSISFAHQQEVLGQMRAKLDAMATNPLGYTPQQLATARTSINQNTAVAAKQAMGSAAAFAAARGAADVGSGTTGQLAGEIASGAAQSKAQQLAGLSESNQQLKQQNYWNAISGLNSVGSQYGGAGGTAIGGAGSSAESSVKAGELNLATKQTGWSNAMGIVGGIGGLATAGAGVLKAMKAPNQSGN